MPPAATSANHPLPAGVDEGNIFYEQSIPQDRINQAILESGFAGPTEVFTGNVQVKDTVYSPRTSLLTVIDDACDAEFPGVANRGVFRDGTFFFHGRLARFNPGDTQYHITEYAAGDKAACVCRVRLELALPGLRLGTSRQRIINAALATPRGDPRRRHRGADRHRPRLRSPTYGRSLMVGREPAHLLRRTERPARRIRRDASSSPSTTSTTTPSPQIRVEELVLKSRHPDWADAAATWTLLCNADISDIVNVAVSNPGVSVDADFFIEGVRYNIQPLNGDYALVTMSLDLSPRAYWAEGF